MKLLIFIALLALPFFTLAEQSSFPVLSKNFCVQTLNTYGAFYSNDLDERHFHTLSFLEENPCDIVLLQEVLEKSHYKNLENLAKTLNVASIYFDNPSEKEKTSGLAGLIKGEINNSQIHYFPNGFLNGGLIGGLSDMGFINKGFGSLEFKDTSSQNNQKFLIINMHLSHLSQSRRIYQLVLFLKWMLSHPHYFKLPVILAGDFNFSPNSLEFDIVKHILQFKDPYEQIQKKHLCTHACSDSDYSWMNLLIGEGVRDYIFFKSSKKLEITFQSIDVFPKHYKEKPLSDHYGVRGIFKAEYISHSNSSFDDKLSNEIINFKKTIEKISSFLNEENYAFESMKSFIESLKDELKNSESSLIKYLEKS